jgi:hypothetical protein
MSRAFVKEDSEEQRPRLSFRLPARDDPSYDAAAASALLEGARVSEVLAAEEATGYRWGEPRLRAHVEAILTRARQDGSLDDRLEQVAERFLRQASR